MKVKPMREKVLPASMNHATDLASQALRVPQAARPQINRVAAATGDTRKGMDFALSPRSPCNTGTTKNPTLPMNAMATKTAHTLSAVTISEPTGVRIAWCPAVAS